jgi:hypothetical protein
MLVAAIWFALGIVGFSGMQNLLFKSSFSGYLLITFWGVWTVWLVELLRRLARG